MHSDGLVRQIFVALGALQSEPGWTEAEVTLAVTETAKLLPETNDAEALQRAVASQVTRFAGGPPKIDANGLGGIRSASTLIGLDLKGIEPALAGVRAAIATAVQTRQAEESRAALAGPPSDAWKAPVKVAGEQILDREARNAVWRMAGDPGLRARMGSEDFGRMLKDALDDIAPEPGGLNAVFGVKPRDATKLTLLKLPITGLNTGDLALAVAQLAYTINRADRDALSLAITGHPDSSRSINSVTQAAFKARGVLNGDVLELGYSVDPRQIAIHGFAGKQAEVEHYVVAAFEKLRAEMAKGSAASSIKI